jgi:translation elongation factor EF-Tu-like GTPase
MSDLILVKAKIKMKATEEGGRKTGFVSGYRPNHVFEYENGKMINSWVGDIQFNDFDLINPGEEKIALVRFIYRQELLDKYLQIGRKWWIHEGPNQLGEAEVLEIL